MSGKVFLHTALLIALLVTLVPTAFAQDQPKLTFLHADGQAIRNEAGDPVLLRGINMDNYYYLYASWPEPTATYATEEDIAGLAAMGANVIRLAVHYQFFESGYDLVDRYLEWCEKYGIYVVIDMHVPPGGEEGSSSIWEDPALQQQLIDLWGQIASRYADRAVVAGYDLLNEPSPPDPAQWWDLAERLTAAIRQVDTRHMIFAETPMFQQFDLRRLADDNVVYSYHYYEPFAVTHAGADWVADLPIPATTSYPGDILTSFEWVNTLGDLQLTEAPTDGWVEVTSGPLTIPAGVDFIDPAAFVWKSAQAYFDDLWLTVNGVPFDICNSDMETASLTDSASPACWIVDVGDSTGQFDWSAQEAHSGAYSLYGQGGANYAGWSQQAWAADHGLAPVKEGDVVEVGGWVKGISAEPGSAYGINLIMLSGVWTHYDLDQLRRDVQPYHDWAQQENVPLWVGEFGAMRYAPGQSSYNLLRDDVTLFNELGVGWAMWSYRDEKLEGFGLYYGPPDQTTASAQVVPEVYDILEAGFRGE